VKQPTYCQKPMVTESGALLVLTITVSLMPIVVLLVLGGGATYSRPTTQGLEFIHLKAITGTTKFCFISGARKVAV
jgi:hypothetical protein